MLQWWVHDCQLDMSSWQLHLGLSHCWKWEWCHIGGVHFIPNVISGVLDKETSCSRSCQTSSWRMPLSRLCELIIDYCLDGSIKAVVCGTKVILGSHTLNEGIINVFDIYWKKSRCVYLRTNHDENILIKIIDIPLYPFFQTQ